MFSCPILDGTALYRAEVLRGTPYTETARLVDHAMWNQLAPGHRLGNLPRLMYGYRAHPSQLSVTEASAIGAHQRMLTLQRFRTLNPTAPAEDVAGFHRIVMARASPLDHRELEGRRRFFLRYLNPPDPEARRCMRRRWRRLYRFGVRRGERRRQIYRDVADALAGRGGQQAYPDG